MKMHLEALDGLNTVNSYGPGYVEVNHERHEGTVLVVPTGPVGHPEIAGFDALEAAHLDALIASEPEVVLLGTGARHRFVHPRLLAGLAARQIGVEAMTTAAACRTFNILVAEGRRVVALLLRD